METETGEVAFTQIEKEFKETFGYIRQDHYCPASGIQPVDNSLVC